MHHLSESKFLGDEKHVRSTLDQVSAFIERLNDSEVKANMLDEYNYYDSLLADWVEYKSLNAETLFPEWCALKGQDYGFWPIYYYDK